MWNVSLSLFLSPSTYRYINCGGVVCQYFPINKREIDFQTGQSSIYALLDNITMWPARFNFASQRNTMVVLVKIFYVCAYIDMMKVYQQIGSIKNRTQLLDYGQHVSIANLHKMVIYVFECIYVVTCTRSVLFYTLWSAVGC